MNMESNFSNDQIKSDLNSIFNSKTESQIIERDALMLQANFLSEIERLSKEKGINRKDIALKIRTSPSYLTQVFRGDKPLNFITLAKIRRALDLKFEVKGFFKSEKKTEVAYKFGSTPFVSTHSSSLGDGYAHNSFDGSGTQTIVKNTLTYKPLSKVH